MVTKMCLKCGTEFEVNPQAWSAVGGDQLRHHATCPSCGAVHHLFQSGTWSQCPGEDKEDDDS
jgi:DNA-directed RNA polymerase subunit RPC12/RpoP